MKGSSRSTLQGVAAAAALVAGLSTPADAARVFAGFLIAASRLEGAPLPAGTFAEAESLEPNGTGFELVLGYRFGQRLPLRLGLGATRHDTSHPDTPFSDNHIRLELDYLLVTNRPIRPYVSVGLGGTWLHPSHILPDVDTRGGCATAGGGLLYSLGRSWALNLGGRAEFFNWTSQRTRVNEPGGGAVTVERSIDRRGHGGRLTFGLTWGL